MRTILVSLILVSCITGCRSGETAEPPSTLLAMSYLERFSEKMFFAAESDNWELADVYAHELEEIAEDLVEGGYEAHDIPLADFAVAFVPAVNAVADAIDAQNYERFLETYTAMTATCNACHAAVGYGAVRIILPESASRPYPGQQFVP